MNDPNREGRFAQPKYTGIHRVISPSCHLIRVVPQPRRKGVEKTYFPIDLLPKCVGVVPKLNSQAHRLSEQGFFSGKLVNC